MFPSVFGVCAEWLPGQPPLPPPSNIGLYCNVFLRAKLRMSMTHSINRIVLTWQIYKDGKFSHFIDGSEEYMSSWMRYIQCARYKDEQNMTVFQYCGNIYYRAFRHIPAGRELLVWYDEKYSEFIDIPALLKARTLKGMFFLIISLFVCL